MDYKRVLSPVQGKNNWDIYLESVEKNINEVQRCWNIQSAYEQNLEIIVNEDVRNFVSDFMYFANDSGQLYKFQEEGVLPHYIDSEKIFYLSNAQ